MSHWRQMWDEQWGCAWQHVCVSVKVMNEGWPTDFASITCLAIKAISRMILTWDSRRWDLRHRQQNTNFLDCILIGIFNWENVLNFHGCKSGRHFERRAAIGRRNTPHYSYIFTCGSIHIQVPACIRNIVYSCIFSAVCYLHLLRKRIFNCCNVLLSGLHIDALHIYTYQNLVKIRVWQLTTAQSHCWVCVTSSWSVLHSSAFLPQSKVYSVQTRLVSGKVEALVTRLLPSPLSSKMDSSRT